VLEVTNVSRHGFWILIGARELFLPFAKFPWFEDAPVSQILDVEMAGPGHLYWPRPDIDLAVESIEKPEQFPFVSRGSRRAPGPMSRKSGRHA
jgi:hypothetical protein